MTDVKENIKPSIKPLLLLIATTIVISAFFVFAPSICSNTHHCFLKNKKSLNYADICEEYKVCEMVLSRTSQKLNILKARELFKGTEQIKKNEQKALELLVTLANDNDPRAPQLLGHIYGGHVSTYKSNVIPFDLDKAKNWYLNSLQNPTKTNSIYSFLFLGDMYLYHAQFIKSFAWYKVASYVGLEDLTSNKLFMLEKRLTKTKLDKAEQLSESLIEEFGKKYVEENFDQLSAPIMERLPKSSDIYDLIKLGQIYNQTPGPKDLVKAYAWLTAAKYAGVDHAQNLILEIQDVLTPKELSTAKALGKSYIEQYSIPIARRYFDKTNSFRKDIKHGVWHRSLLLGDIYFNSPNAADKIEAYAWFSVANIFGYPEALPKLQLIKDALSEEELVQAKKRADRLVWENITINNSVEQSIRFGDTRKAILLAGLHLGDESDNPPSMKGHYEIDAYAYYSLALELGHEDIRGKLNALEKGFTDEEKLRAKERAENFINWLHDGYEEPEQN
jgi:TPR repeat protein